MNSNRWIGCLLTAGICCLGVGTVHAQLFAPNEREVRTEVNGKDKGDMWTLDLKFKDPRMIRVYVPGQGSRIYWYLWYQVINRTGEPRKFVPYFEIVTLDYPAAFADGIYPTVEEAIRKLEDPTGYQRIKNSVTISAELIPMSLPDAFPRAVTGVAIWEANATVGPTQTIARPAFRPLPPLSSLLNLPPLTPQQGCQTCQPPTPSQSASQISPSPPAASPPAEAKKADADVKQLQLADTTRFSIFIRGLSNGYVIVDPLVEGKASYTRYKTLQLNFRRTGDRYSLDSRDMVFLSPAEWLYRPGGRTIFEEKK